MDHDTPKAHQRRVLILPGFVAGRLLVHLSGMADESPRAQLFTGRTGQPLRYGSWRRWQFDSAARGAGLAGVTPHALRATHGSWVADKHGVMQAAKRLGHSIANVTTRHYARAIDGHDQAVADDLDTQHRQQTRPATGSRIARGSHEPADGASRDPAAEA